MQRSMYAKLSSKEFLWIWESAKRSTSSQFVSRGVSLQSQWGKFVSIWLNSFSPIFNPSPSPSVLHSFIVWIINRNFFQPINMWKWKSNAEICKEYFVSDAVSSLTNQSVFFFQTLKCCFEMHNVCFSCDTIKEEYWNAICYSLLCTKIRLVIQIH